MSLSRRSARMFWLYRLQITALKHPEVGNKTLDSLAGGLGRSPMERSGTDCDFDGVRALGALDAAAAVRLPLRSFAPWKTSPFKP
jgi:hypothetical protein